MWLSSNIIYQISRLPEHFVNPGQIDKRLQLPGFLPAERSIPVSVIPFQKKSFAILQIWQRLNSY